MNFSKLKFQFANFQYSKITFAYSSVFFLQTAVINLKRENTFIWKVIQFSYMNSISELIRLHVEYSEYEY